MRADTLCAECGADFYPDTPAGKGQTCGAAGYATRADGSRVCYSCAHAAELRDLQATCAAPRKDSRICAYLEGETGRVTLATWTGRALPVSGYVTGRSTRRNAYSDARVSVRMRGPNGTEWIGRGYGSGMSIMLRPTAETLRNAGAQS